MTVDLDTIKFNELHEEIEDGQDFEIVVDFKPLGELNLQKFY
jgi:HKD family nuclease